MKYKKGDKVRVRKDLIVNKTYIGLRFVEDMSNYCGKKTKIVEAKNHYYRLKCDNGDWQWTDEMLEPVKKKPKMGDFVEVSDDGVKWIPDPRILIKLCDDGVVVTSRGYEKEFINNKIFATTQWKYWRWPAQKQEPNNLSICNTCFICKSVSHSGNLFCNKFEMDVKPNMICDDFEMLIS